MRDRRPSQMRSFAALSLLYLFLGVFSAVASANYCASDNTGSGYDSIYSTYQSSGACQSTCSGYAFAIVQGYYCWCSDIAPNGDSTSSNSDCSDPCPGYPSDYCGSTSNNLYYYYAIGKASGTASASTASETTTSSSSTKAAVSIVYVTPSQSSTSTASSSSATSTSESSALSVTPSSDSSSSAATESSASMTASSAGVTSTPSLSAEHTSKSSSSGGFFASAGRVAGVFVAIAFIIALIVAGLLFYFLFYRKRHDSQALPTSSPPISPTPSNVHSPLYGRSRSGSTLVGKWAGGTMGEKEVIVDQRLDPRSMLMRFESSYSRRSLRDDEDYSRRVLQVRNPDMGRPSMASERVPTPGTGGITSSPNRPDAEAASLRSFVRGEQEKLYPRIGRAKDQAYQRRKHTFTSSGTLYFYEDSRIHGSNDNIDFCSWLQNRFMWVIIRSDLKVGRFRHQKHPSNQHSHTSNQANKSIYPQEHSYDTIIMSVEEVTKAVEEVKIDEAPATAQEVQDETKAAGAVGASPRVFFGNLAFKTTQSELRELVSPTAVPTKVFLPFKNRRPLGYAFLTFSTEEDADRVVSEFEGREIAGRKLHVDKAKISQTKKKRSDKPAEGEENKGIAINIPGQADALVNADENAAVEGAHAEADATAPTKAPRKRKNRKNNKKKSSTTANANGSSEGEGEGEQTGDEATTKKDIPEGAVEDGTQQLNNTAPTQKEKKSKTPKQKGPPTGLPSSTTVFVANLPYDYTSTQLRALFTAHSHTPLSASVPPRPVPSHIAKKIAERGESRRGRGFGFVVFEGNEGQGRAVEGMNGVEVEGRKIGVKVAIDPPVKQGEEGEVKEEGAVNEDSGHAATEKEEGEIEVDVKEEAVSA
ncbi:hypothetical protein G7K_2254-t1 [Saitoella complicata NRRL Y-17804]|uniref:WSC domain-containing protein n=1 Tax=Saitoella complicata (strain BCRC 22490 / CBS 7301 / JCM 7358 / NBRC 10748 / NRRL Y-17804) TaxID=698492 RepID=A0A0E9NEE4_SAICN|nr:hypothetical protein G7K_2254-t1 [Saitoella complicata NRRL Y-17804]